MTIEKMVVHLRTLWPVWERAKIKHEVEWCDGVAEARFVSGAPLVLEIDYDPESISARTITEYVSQWDETALNSPRHCGPVNGCKSCT